MAFSDEVRRNLNNAPGAAARAEQERFQNNVDLICQRIKEFILYKSENYTDSRVLFRADFCVLATSNNFDVKILEKRKPNLFNNTSEISEITISEASRAFQRAVKNQLARDGIQVSEWMLCSNRYSDTDSRYFRGRYDKFDLYERSRSDMELMNFDAAKPFRCRQYETIGGASGVVYNVEFTQGNVKYKIGPMPVFFVTYQ